tara:strand:- start:212 stop:709 length:498 start_codon:yes stop_codon:yes gene_type:complete
MFRKILANSFLLRVGHVGRRTGVNRIVEVTYCVTDDRKIILSGYPGPRDWVANMSQNPEVMIYTVEGEYWYRIKGISRLVSNKEQRNRYIIQYINRWNNLPGNKRLLISFTLNVVHLREKLHLPWWGPFYLVQKIFEKMPCIEITLVEEPQQSHLPPPPPSPLRK